MEQPPKNQTENNPPASQSQSTNPGDNSLYVVNESMLLNKCYLEIMTLCNQINHQLFRNVQLIQQFIKLPPTQKPHSKKSNNSTQDHSNASKNDYSQHQLDQHIMKNGRESHKRRKHKETDEDSYVPQAEEYDGSFWAISQSKNMPKNFRKALFNFIAKEQNFVTQVLQRTATSIEEFTKSVNYYSERINSIADIREFWSDEVNKLAKVYRILSMQYLRKHSLGYIFNSKVNKYHKHIKYRQIMIQGVKNPGKFTSMKEF